MEPLNLEQIQLNDSLSNPKKKARIVFGETIDDADEPIELHRL